jgi:hypothetical protein
MSKSIVRLAFGLLAMLVIIGGLMGCSQAPEPAYAGQMTEEALQAMSNCDYLAHMALYTPDAQAAINEADFNTRCQEIKAIIGDYIDKEFWRTKTQDSYIVVEYTARFSDEPDDVEVTVYFQEIDDEMYIAGFWLSSPKIIASLESGSE